MSTVPVPDSLQAAVEEIVTSWPDVSGRNVFGHRGYVRGGKMFAFLPRNGVSVKAEDAADADALYARDGVTAFAYKGMPMRQWPILPLLSEDDLDAAVDALRRAYDTVG